MAGLKRGNPGRRSEGIAGIRIGGAAALAAAALALLTAAPVAGAAPGDLDPSFARDGKKLTTFGAPAAAYSVAIGGKGRIVAAGTKHDRWFAAARYKPNGNLDDSFDGNGRTTTSFGDRHLYNAARGVAIADGGRVVAVGGIGTPGSGHPNRFAVVRYRSDGTLDRSFSNDGIATTNFFPGGHEETATSVAIDDGGRILVAGYFLDGTQTPRFALARYRRHGGLQRPFGNEGMMTTTFPGGAAANAVTIQAATNRIFVAGAGGPDGAGDFALARYRGGGRLEREFGNGGKVITDFGANDGAYSVAVHSGDVIAAGFTASQSRRSERFALARYRPDGRLDEGFGGDGKVTTGFGNKGSEARSVAVDPHARVVAAGTARVDRDRMFALARYKADGNRDRSFGVAGKVTTSFQEEAGDSTAESLAIDSRDRIVVAGHTRGSFALARYVGYRR
jgi:uncharacterized delta-60 repeat protein